jgi:hypothetical protein
MERRSVVRGCLAVIALFAISSCATPPPRWGAVWKDENYRGGYVKKVFVIGAARQEKVRVVFENEFVNQLKAHGADAVASGTVIPFEKMMDKELVASKVKESGCDSVLITRVLYVTTADKYKPMPKPNWNEFYSESYGYSQAPPGPRTTMGKFDAQLEMKLFDTKSEQPLWAASAQMLVEDDPQKEIKLFVQMLMEKLAADKFIK